MTDSVHLTCPSCVAINRIPLARVQQQPVCGKCKAPLFPEHPINLTDANGMKHLNRSDVPMVVDFWAPWCGPCLQFAPIYTQVAAQWDVSARFAKLDTQANPQLAGHFSIRSIPTLAVFANGQEVARTSGAMPAQALQRWVRQALQLA